MDLIVHQVVELEEVHIPHRHPVIEGLAGAPVVEHRFAVLGEAGLGEAGPDVLLGGAVEDGGHHLPAQLGGGPAQMDLQHLADVHPGGDAQGVEDDVQGPAVGEVGHILLGQHPGDDALVAVAARHLVPHADLALLGDVAPHHLVYPRRKLVAVLVGKHLDIHDDAVFAVGHLKGGIPDLPGLFAKDGPEQPLLRVKLGLPLGGDFAHQDIPGVDLGPHPDDAPLV